MRILVLADIHSNWPALSAIREPFDACLVLGDIVDYGTQPEACVNWVRNHATAAIRGNHDHAVAQRVIPRGGSGFRGWTAATRPLHWERLDQQQLKYLGRLPVTQRVTLGGVRYVLVHGTPRDPMDEYLGDQPLGWQQRLTHVDADIVCVGHTHLQFHLQLDGKQVLNPGSVGQPRDGDWRAAYAIIEDGVVQLKRVEYDVAATLAHLQSCGVPDDVLAIATTVLTHGGGANGGGANSGGANSGGGTS